MRVVTMLFHDVYRESASASGFAGPAADRYKLTVREFDEQLMGMARARSAAPMLVRELPSEPDGLVPFAITVDDGGVSYYTTVAERLEALGWRGHCFVTTGRIGQAGFLDKYQIRDLNQRAHVIGSHSVSHPTRFSACAWDDMVREWTESRKALEDILGEPVTVASVPGGYFSPAVAKAAREGGILALFTSEPTTHVRTIFGCSVLGRFAVRRGCTPDFAGSVVALKTGVHAREWAFWNAKKIVKAAAGAAYPHLTAGHHRRWPVPRRPEWWHAFVRALGRKAAA